MSGIVGQIWSIEWTGSNCPEGWPKVLCEMFTPGHQSRAPKEVSEFPRTLGGGYGLTIRAVSKEMRPLKQESLAVVRRKRAKRRIEKKYPLLAEQMLTEEIESKPEYYQGITDEKLEQARNEMFAEYAKRREDLMNRVGELIVYADEPAECCSKSTIFVKSSQE